VTRVATHAERRRDDRLSMSLPLAIQGYSSDGSAWEETSTTHDASMGGLSFTSQNALVKGQVLHLALPLPKSLRQYDHGAPSYYVYALVRDVLVDDDGSRIGVMFFGKEPPRGFDRTPGARFLLPSDVAPETLPEPPPPATPLRVTERKLPPSDPLGHRQHERFDIFVNFELEQVDEWGAVLAEERTVAENLSLGGTRCLTSIPFRRGDVLTLRELGGSFETRAQVVNTYMGSDRIRRINLKFLDGRSPTHLVRSH
jgi:hypothetical protein